MMIKPQPGFQYDFVVSRADILIAGAAAGVGKTFSLLLDPLRHISNSGWGAVVFRRTMPQIRNEGGLWDSSNEIYIHVGGVPKETTCEWKFQSGATFKFAHLEHEKNIYDWQGSEIPYIGFDELTHFSKKMFFYMLSRNRSTCGIKPRIRGTCNPDPESFLVNGPNGWGSGLISWWIGEDGFPIKDRSGALRYFIKNNEDYYFGSSKKEVIEKAGHIIDPVIESSEGIIKAEDLIKSLTFIPGSIYGNKELLTKNPEYLSNLLAQDESTKASLLEGNWKVVVSDHDLFDYYELNDCLGFEGEKGEKRVVADIALEGKDRFTMFYANGFNIEDAKIIPKCNGQEAIEEVRKFAEKNGVRSRNISFDSNGIGSFLKGWFKTSYAFLNNGKTH